VIYNDYQSLHQAFENNFKIEPDQFQKGAKLAGTDLEPSEISRIFAKYSKNMLLDYDKFNDIYLDKKKDDLFLTKYRY
jgi:hypothetical protein